MDIATVNMPEYWELLRLKNYQEASADQLKFIERYEEIAKTEDSTCSHYVYAAFLPPGLH